MPYSSWIFEESERAEEPLRILQEPEGEDTMSLSSAHAHAHESIENVTRANCAAHSIVEALLMKSLISGAPRPVHCLLGNSLQFFGREERSVDGLDWRTRDSLKPPAAEDT